MGILIGLVRGLTARDRVQLIGISVGFVSVLIAQFISCGVATESRELQERIAANQDQMAALQTFQAASADPGARARGLMQLAALNPRATRRLSLFVVCQSLFTGLAHGDDEDYITSLALTPTIEHRSIPDGASSKFMTSLAQSRSHLVGSDERREVERKIRCCAMRLSLQYCANRGSGCEDPSREESAERCEPRILEPADGAVLQDVWRRLTADA